ncbi:MAG: SctK family type III secretion system sorting platform protein [Kiritimatiellae bacterium]|nr:SctK family type III secretion system sorting platform protein [Kiritimatiellia bacterium]
MDRVIDMDRAREFVADRMLWPRVRDFLWDFASQLHPSWLENMPDSKEGGSHRVKSWLLSQLGVGACFYDFPKDCWGRLPLLDSATLESIVKWLGALACVDSLRRVMGGAVVRELKAKLPGVYPDVFAYSMYFKGLKVEIELKEGESLSDHVLSVGFGLLLTVASELPDDVLKRLTMKLPKSLSQIKPSSLKQSSINLSLLLKLKFPEAYKLCCS